MPEITSFPIHLRNINPSVYASLGQLGRSLTNDLRENSEDTIRVYKGKKAVSVISFRVNKSKPIIDQIDTVLAQHYGFSDEELDYIINYDIKYRMGDELFSEEGE